MFCSNCGKKIKEDSNFCYKCGFEVGIKLPVLKNNKNIETEAFKNKLDKESRKNQAEINIISKERAEEYLDKLWVLFFFVFLGFIFFKFVNYTEEQETFIALSFIYIGLLAYFVYFSAKVLKEEKLSRWNAVWCILFAPISWIYLYPLITKPLKAVLKKPKIDV